MVSGRKLYSDNKLIIKNDNSKYLEIYLELKKVMEKIRGTGEYCL